MEKNSSISRNNLEQDNHNYSFILFRIVGDILAIAIRQGDQSNTNGEVKVDLFADDIIS